MLLRRLKSIGYLAILSSTSKTFCSLLEGLRSKEPSVFPHGPMSLFSPGGSHIWKGIHSEATEKLCKSTVMPHG